MFHLACHFDWNEKNNESPSSQYTSRIHQHGEKRVLFCQPRKIVLNLVFDAFLDYPERNTRSLDNVNVRVHWGQCELARFLSDLVLVSRRKLGQTRVNSGFFHENPGNLASLV